LISQNFLSKPGYPPEKWGGRQHGGNAAALSLSNGKEGSYDIGLTLVIWDARSIRMGKWGRYVDIGVRLITTLVTAPKESTESF